MVNENIPARINHQYWIGKRVLVTGHTGFKGSWLTIWLNKLGCHVTGIGLQPQTNPALFNLARVSELCDSYFIDIRNLKKLNEVIKHTNPELVFHLAAQSLVRQSYMDPINTVSTNVMGTLNLLESVREISSVRSAVFITSDKVYKNNDKDDPYKETDTLGGDDPYSASKSASELIINCYRNSLLKNSKINIATARAGNVIGGGDWAQDRLIPDAIKAWSDDKSLNLRYPNSIRPWQHVLEPLYGYLILAEKLETNSGFGKSYNFGPLLHEMVSVENLISLAKNIWGKADIKYDSNSTMLKESNILRLDSSLAKEELHILPKWNLQTSVEKTINWYKKQIQGENSFDLCIADIQNYENTLSFNE